jgi:hypothetical protein
MFINTRKGLMKSLNHIRYDSYQKENFWQGQEKVLKFKINLVRIISDINNFYYRLYPNYCCRMINIIEIIKA